jgi:acyl-CoA hydrolase
MKSEITLQFLSAPTDINYGGKVHGGMVMKWIDQAAFACASQWSQSYCVTVYVGGIRFYDPIHIGYIVKTHAYIIYTGNTSMHIAVDVFSKGVREEEFTKNTHCIVVFVSVDEKGSPIPVTSFVPANEKQERLQSYALNLMALRKNVEDEMKPYLENHIES